jgi:hypothetical protein
MTTRQPAPAPRPSTVLGRRLGAELRRLRGSRTLQQPAASLNCTTSKIVRIEQGQVPVRDPDLLALLTLYGAPDETQPPLLTLAAHDRDRRKHAGWWQHYPQLGGLLDYIELEDSATTLRTCQLAFIPGLLQTPDYTRALATASGGWASTHDIDRFVEARQTRQGRLAGTDPLHLHAVVWEAALHQHTGGRHVLHAQLNHLAASTDLPNVTLQILPFTTDALAAMPAAFVLLSFTEPGALDVVYLDTPTAHLWLEHQDDAHRHGTLFTHAADTALTPAASRTLITRLAKEL